MAEKSYITWLDERTYVEVEFVTAQGRVVSFVVRLMRIDGDHVFGIVRYDTAHGMPHRDILDRQGRILRKDWLAEMTFDQALTHAKEDLCQNYESYLRRFQAA
jgi:hypothetical protein